MRKGSNRKMTVKVLSKQQLAKLKGGSTNAGKLEVKGLEIDANAKK